MILDDTVEIGLCAISHEIESDMLTNCGHAFKLEYLLQWYIRHSSCPYCRAPIVLSQCRVRPGVYPLRVTENADVVADADADADVVADADADADTDMVSDLVSDLVADVVANLVANLVADEDEQQDEQDNIYDDNDETGSVS